MFHAMRKKSERKPPYVINLKLDGSSERAQKFEALRFEVLRSGVSKTDLLKDVIDAYLDAWEANHGPIDLSLADPQRRPQVLRDRAGRSRVSGDEAVPPIPKPRGPKPG